MFERLKNEINEKKIIIIKVGLLLKYLKRTKLKSSKEKLDIPHNKIVIGSFQKMEILG